jgi:hypothetical protein
MIYAESNISDLPSKRNRDDAAHEQEREELPPPPMGNTKSSRESIDAPFILDTRKISSDSNNTPQFILNSRKTNPSNFILDSRTSSSKPPVVDSTIQSPN